MRSDLLPKHRWLRSGMTVPDECLPIRRRYLQACEHDAVCDSCGSSVPLLPLPYAQSLRLTIDGKISFPRPGLYSDSLSTRMGRLARAALKPKDFPISQLQRPT